MPNIQIRNVNVSLDLFANHIGIEADASIIPNNNGYGVRLHNIQNSSVLLVGNVVSGNKTGIYASEVFQVELLFNYIGLSTNGLDVLSNDSGVTLRRIDHIRIINNVISGNRGNGVGILGDVQTASLRGNIIGLDAAGNNPRGNGVMGIYVSGADTSEFFEILDNTIADHKTVGIRLQNDTNEVEIRGNLIGVSHDGTTPFGNHDGIDLFRVDRTLIRGNIIAGNTASGIELSYVNDTRIFSNLIGASVAQNRSPISRQEGFNELLIPTMDINYLNETLPIGNNEDGIRIVGDSSTNIIGASACYNGLTVIYDGDDPGFDFDGIESVVVERCIENESLANQISFNGGSGVHIEGGMHNEVRVNRITNNAALSVDLVGNIGQTPNDSQDADSGPNGLQNTQPFSYTGNDYVIDEQGEALTIVLNLGVLDSPNTAFTDVYISPNCQNGIGEAFLFLGRLESGKIDDLEFKVWTEPLIFEGDGFVSLIVTSIEGSSEFSECIPVSVPLFQHPETEPVTDENPLTLATCTVTTIHSRTPIRVGPGNHRGIFTTVNQGLDLQAISQFVLEDDSAWWKIENTSVPNGSSANELWVNQNDTTQSDCDDIPIGIAPPVIIRIDPTPTVLVTIVVDPNVTTPLPPGNINPPTLIPCFSVSVNHSPFAGGTVNLSPSSNCAGGYQAGTTITAQATPFTGNQFNRWEGSCIGGSSTANPVSFSSSQNCTLTIVWTIIN